MEATAMIRATVWAVVLALAGMAASPAALAEKRVALVIGNSAYEHVTRLPNPANDAEDMAAALGALGFAVDHAADLSRAGLEEAVADFADRAVGADVALVFYAGHGIEVDRRNYLIPVDARLANDRRLRFEAVALDDVMASLDAVKGVRIVLLDACRNNPFAAAMAMSSASRSVGRGLSRIEAPGGTLISFAAKEGTIAEDGDGRNSPFTAAPLDRLATPGVEVSLLFRQVRDSVLAATGGQQEPYVSASLPGEPIYLVPPEGAEAAAAPAAGPSAAAEAWNAVRDSDIAADLEAFIAAFPDTFHARLAASRLERLGEIEVAVGVFPEAPAERGYEPGDVIRDCDDCPEMVVVPEGSFTMGSPAGEEGRDDDEGPQHRVTIPRPFAVGKFEVTRGEFETFVRATGHDAGNACWSWNGTKWADTTGKSWRDPGYPEPALTSAERRRIQEALNTGGHDVGTPDGAFGSRTRAGIRAWQTSIGAEPTGNLTDDQVRGLLTGASVPDQASYPVACVNWDDAKAYVGWLSQKTGQAYRLLSEAEWEYAARGQTQPGNYPRYSFGNDEGQLCRFGNVADRTVKNRFSGSTIAACTDGYLGTAPVGKFVANAFGLYDVHGNVWEWVEDCWNGSHEGAPTNGTARTTGDCGRRVLRGGSWYNVPGGLRSAVRIRNDSDDRINIIGFRVARTLIP